MSQSKAQQNFYNHFHMTPRQYLDDVLYAPTRPVPPQPETIEGVLRHYRVRIDSMGISWPVDGRAVLKALFSEDYGDEQMRKWEYVINLFASVTIMALMGKK